MATDAHATITTSVELVKLADCPPGLFWFGGTLCFKSEYGDDAYCVETGEFFVGGAVGEAARRALLVQPIAEHYAVAALNAVAQTAAR